MATDKLNWSEWNADKIREQIRGQVASNMELACQFVEHEARRNLRAIQEPKGKFYRRVILASRVSHEVEVKRNSIEGRVGERKGSKHPEKPYGFYVEVGSSTAPAHPWLRPAVFNNIKAILAILSS